MSLRDKILATKDIQSEIITIPQWDVTVEVRGLTGRQRSIILQDVIDTKGRINYQKLYPQLVVMTTFDPETGKPVFLVGDIDAISEKSGGALEAIAQVAMRLSGLNEGAGKNSGETQSADSTSN